MNYYYVNINIGSPPKRQALITDTGSYITAIPCQPLCKECGKHINSYYTLSSKKIYFYFLGTSEILKCDSDKCKTFSVAHCGEDQSCAYSVVKF